MGGWEGAGGRQAAWRGRDEDKGKEFFRRVLKRKGRKERNRKEHVIVLAAPGNKSG